MVLNPSSNVENVDLAIEYVLGLFKGVVCGSARAGFDLVESGCEVRGGVLGLCANCVEVSDCSVLTLGKRNEFVTCALNDGEGDEVSGHVDMCVDEDV